MAIQSRFDVHGPQHFPGAKQEHPECIRVQPGQSVHGHQRGLQVVILIRQRNQILGNGLRPFAAKVQSDDFGYIIGQFSGCVNESKKVCQILDISALNTHLTALPTITRWHRSPSTASPRTAHWSRRR